MQETSFDLADTESLKEKVLQVLKQIHEEKDEEMIQVDMWCHFGHAYVTKVDEGDKLRSLLLFALRKRTKFSWRSFQDKHGLLLSIKSVAILRFQLGRRCFPIGDWGDLKELFPLRELPGGEIKGFAFFDQSTKGFI